MTQILDVICEALVSPALPDYDCNNGARMRVIDGADAQTLRCAIEAAKRNGFDVFAENTLESNRYITFVRPDALLHIYLCPSERKLRVIADPNTTRYDASRVPYTRRCACALWQFETDHTYIDCGMCFILRLADNSFFVIDSGHYLQPNDHLRLYRFLRERTPAGENVVIAGWFFSHAHDDHVCQFMKFLQDEFSDVVIEKLYYNMCEPDGRDSHFWKESNKKIIRSL